MKYVVILGDGMADYPVDAFDGKTILEVADKPTIDYMAQHGEMGMVKTVQDGMKPGSDVANLSVMGYDTKKCYSGRSPLEAASIGVPLKDNDVTFRCNLVTLSDEENYEDKTMLNIICHARSIYRRCNLCCTGSFRSVTDNTRYIGQCVRDRSTDMLVVTTGHKGDGCTRTTGCTYSPTECRKSADIVLDIDGYQITYKQCPIHLLF